MVTRDVSYLGESLIPLINRLQDIFSQVRAGCISPTVSLTLLQAASERPVCLVTCEPPCLQVTVDLKLALPQVAVIGSQSSGKSSVLESLVGSIVLHARTHTHAHTHTHTHTDASKDTSTTQHTRVHT